jgi:hypothetical protein
MKIEQAVFKRLTTDVNVREIVGTRVCPLKLPQTPTYPSITYQLSDLDPTYSMDGYSHLSSAVFVIISYGETYSATTCLAGYVKQALEGIKKTIYGVTILGSFLTDENRAFDHDLNVYSIAQTITFHFND